jgi:hypothetical protein
LPPGGTFKASIDTTIHTTSDEVAKVSHRIETLQGGAGPVLDQSPEDKS